MSRYVCYAGKAEQIIHTFEAYASDHKVLKSLANDSFLTGVGGVRLVERIEPGNIKLKVFEDWDQPLTNDHPIFARSSISIKRRLKAKRETKNRIKSDKEI